MVLLVLMFFFLVLGAILGVIWKWRIWILFALVAVTSCLGSLYVAEFPSRAAIFNDVWSFLYFLLNYGVYVGLVAGAGASGALLGLLATRRLGKRRETSEPVSRPKV